MMDEHSQVEQLLTSAYSKAISIRDRTKVISQKRFPSDNPLRLLKAIECICEEIINLLLNLRNEYENKLKPIDDIKRDIIFLLRFLVWFASHLRYIDSATTEATPWSLIRPNEEFAKIVLPGNVFVFRPQWTYNYGIIQGLIGLYLDALRIEKSRADKILTELKGDFYIISFPGLERKNILLHANFGHEIGHPVAKKFHDKEKNEGKVLSEIRGEVEIVYGDKTLPQIERDRKISQLTENIHNIRQKGLGELISDLVGLRLFGPSSLFAAEEVAHLSYAFDDVGELTGYYPPWRYRIRVMLEDLQERGIIKIFDFEPDDVPIYKEVVQAAKEKINFLKTLVSQKNDITKIKEHTPIKIAYDSIAKTLPNVKKFLNEELDNHTYKIETRLLEIILPLCNRLSNKIPPNAVEIEGPFSSKPVDFRDIINAGWFYKLAKLSSLFGYKDTEEYEKEYDIINRLTLKGIELSYISSKYNYWKENLKITEPSK